MKKAFLLMMLMLGFVMMTSEGSAYYWANVAGVILFVRSASLLGLYDKNNN